MHVYISERLREGVVDVLKIRCLIVCALRHMKRNVCLNLFTIASQHQIM